MDNEEDKDDDKEEECEFCCDTGFVTNIEYDSDIHQFVYAGLIKCKHPGHGQD